MTAWTREKPTKPGWYWWRWAPKSLMLVLDVHVRDGKMQAFSYLGLNPIDECDGEWQGPIEPEV